MLHQYAEQRDFKNWIITVPVMTPKLSSYWLYFVTSTSYKLALNLVDCMKVEVVARDTRLQDILGIRPHTYRETATFRPKGLKGRLYWYSIVPFHYFIFGGMIRGIAKGRNG